MITLSERLAKYLGVRHALGWKLRGAESVLGQFVSFAEEEETEIITLDLALRWARQPPDAKPARWAKRLGMLRGFARYVSAEEPRTQVPPTRLLPHRYGRREPRLLSDGEIERLLQAARSLASPTGLRAVTYEALLGLLAVTGMRLGEAVHLEREDVDLSQGLLTLRRTKRDKSRYVPIHDSTCEILREYESVRDRIHPAVTSPRFFLAERGRPLTEWSVGYTFNKLLDQTDLRGPEPSRKPQIHDLRHRFAVSTVLDWYRAGVDVEVRLPDLATYLGHTHVNDTYWYITAVPELMKYALERRYTTEEVPS
jgi:integrase/recombinase XerD